MTWVWHFFRLKVCCVDIRLGSSFGSFTQNKRVHSPNTWLFTMVMGPSFLNVPKAKLEMTATTVLPQNFKAKLHVYLLKNHPPLSDHYYYCCCAKLLQSGVFQLNFKQKTRIWKKSLENKN
jgi:hypothetical protein